jgi:hypothetical protein
MNRQQPIDATQCSSPKTSCLRVFLCHLAIHRAQPDGTVSIESEGLTNQVHVVQSEPQSADLVRCPFDGFDDDLAVPLPFKVRLD